MEKIHWRGSFREGSGYGKVARDYVYWLNKFGYDINIVVLNIH